MIGWLARGVRLEQADLDDCAVSDDVREECLRRMATRAAMVLELCVLRPCDLDSLHPLELLALQTAKRGLAADSVEGNPDPGDDMLREMVARATGGDDGASDLGG